VAKYDQALPRQKDKVGDYQGKQLRPYAREGSSTSCQSKYFLTQALKPFSSTQKTGKEKGMSQIAKVLWKDNWGVLDAWGVASMSSFFAL